MPENVKPLELFMALKDQHIMSMNGPVGMNLLTARGEIERVYSNVDDQDKCLRLVMAAYRNFLELMREKENK